MTTPPPRLSPAQAAALTDIRDHQLYVGRDPGSPDYGTGYAGSTLRKLTMRGLIGRGPYEPGRGHPLRLTPAGQTMADALGQRAAGGEV